MIIKNLQFCIFAILDKYIDYTSLKGMICAVSISNKSADGGKDDLLIKLINVIIIWSVATEGNGILSSIKVIDLVIDGILDNKEYREKDGSQ